MTKTIENLKAGKFEASKKVALLAILVFLALC